MWKIKLHKLVVDKDFKKINKKDRLLILRAIYKKLSKYPDKFGKPLRNNLKGYWKLKVSDYRVIYKIERKEILILVLKIGFRKDEEVYKKMINRIRKLKE